MTTPKQNRNHRAETTRFIQWMDETRSELLHQYNLRMPPVSFAEYCAHVWQRVKFQYKPEYKRGEYQAQP